MEDTQSRNMLIALQQFYKKGFVSRESLERALIHEGVKDSSFVIEALLDLFICCGTTHFIAVVRQPEYRELNEIYVLTSIKKKYAILKAIRLLEDEGYKLINLKPRNV